MAKKKPENTPPPRKEGTPQLKNQYALNSHLIKNIERMPFSEQQGHSPNQPRNFVTRELRNILSAQAGVELFPDQSEQQEAEPLSGKFTRRRKPVEPQPMPMPEQLFEMDDYARAQKGFSLPSPQQEYFQKDYSDKKPPASPQQDYYSEAVPDQSQSDYHKHILEQAVTQQRLPQQPQWGAPPPPQNDQRSASAHGQAIPPAADPPFQDPRRPLPDSSQSAWGAPTGAHNAPPPGFGAPPPFSAPPQPPQTQSQQSFGQPPQAFGQPPQSFGQPPQPDRSQSGQRRYSEEEAMASQERHLLYSQQQQKLQQEEQRTRKDSKQQSRERPTKLDPEAEKLAEENAFLHKIYRKMQIDLADQGLIEMPVQRAAIPWHQYPDAGQEEPQSPGAPRQGEARPGGQGGADLPPQPLQWGGPQPALPGPPPQQQQQQQQHPQQGPPQQLQAPQTPPPAQPAASAHGQPNPQPSEPLAPPRRRKRKTRPVDMDGFGLSKTERGTIEVIWRPDGRSITPIYNMVGILKGIEFGDGTKYLRKENDEWVVLDAAGQEVPEQKIARLIIDKGGNVTIFAPNGEKTTLLVSGETIVASVQGATPGQG